MALTIYQDPANARVKAQKSIDLTDAAKYILAEIHPATVRAVYYRLFVQGLISSMSKGNTDAVSRHLVQARVQGHIPSEHILDETGRIEKTASWNNPEEILNAAVRQYKKDRWAMQLKWIVIWYGMGTVRRTLAPALDEYGVGFRVFRGCGSGSSAHRIAEESAANAKSLTMIYIGDRVGAFIEGARDRDAQDHAERVECAEIESMSRFRKTYPSISRQAAKQSNEHTCTPIQIYGRAGNDGRG